MKHITFVTSIFGERPDRSSHISHIPSPCTIVVAQTNGLVEVLSKNLVLQAWSRSKLSRIYARTAIIQYKAIKCVSVRELARIGPR